MAEPLHVLTLNCWGLKYLAAYRQERLQQIGAEIASANPQPSIVALQECWTQQDYLSIREQTKQILPYGKFYFSGIMGGGLAILSKWPIESSNMLRYVLNGRPTAFFRGDWFVGKGVACAKIRISDGTTKGRYLSVFCTHVRDTARDEIITLTEYMNL
jgi:sphingomyelin phosphodiesterase 2